MEISTGIIKEPHFVLIYGTDGVGKTTFAAQAPKPIIVGPESGSNRINVSRAKGVHTFDDVTKAIAWLRNEKHDFKSVGIDSLDWIEPLIWNALCVKHNVSTIEEVGGGYGKGYTEALGVWSNMIAQVRDLRANRDMNVIVIAHEQIRAVNDPLQMLPYDRHMLKLNEKAGAKWREAVEAVLYAGFEDTVFKVNKGDRKAKASDADGGNRKLFTVRRAAYDAKNRLGLPPVLPLSYRAFAEAAEIGEPDSADQVKADIQDLVVALKTKDAGTGARMEAAVIAAEGDLTKLINIRNHARVLVE